MTEKATTYDTILSSFLKGMLARADADNTIIVVRSDHGLQAGPITDDYSIQIEALRPWTEIIVPKTLQGILLNTLFGNQQRLVTGFDFYKTLTTSIVGDETNIMPNPPSWANHLWQEEVAPARTCTDAMVSNDYCRFEGQRTFSAPNLRACNLMEKEQQIVCPLMAENFTNSMSEIVSTTLQEWICPREGSVEPTIPPSLAKMWQVASCWLSSFFSRESLKLSVE